MAQEKTEKLLTFRGRPMVRSGNTIYYGDMSAPYVAMLQINENADFSDMQLPQKVTVQILATDEDLRPKERIKKRTEKGSLYEAINIASIWLERTLSEAQ